MPENITSIRGIGSKTAEKLASGLDIHTTEDLIYHFPRDYEDLSETTPIAKITPDDDQKVITEAEVLAVSGFRTPKKNMHITEAVLQDGTGQAKAIWFNQPYIENQLRQGRSYLFTGSVSQKRGAITFQNPKFDQTDDSPHVMQIVPIYPETEGISSRMLRNWISRIKDDIKDKADYIPNGILERYDLMPLSEALSNIHFPASEDKLKRAKNRLALDELIFVQLAVQEVKRGNRAKEAPDIDLDIELAKAFVNSLSFELTQEQKKTAWAIMQDLENPHPMQRLLEGDVGTGKTVVAGLAMLEVINNGFQVAMMAPTEVLAKQHFSTLTDLFSDFDVRTALLTNNFTRIGYEGTTEKSDKNELRDAINAGKVDLAIGTHALIQRDSQFHNLGMAVIDEQHRFGVKQREELSQKGYSPHLLSLTATPIPRSLALTMYGDLKIAQITERLPGRKPVETEIYEAEDKAKALEKIKEELEHNHQAFVVSPLIEDSQEIDARSAEQEHEYLKEEFPEHSVELMHGKLSSEEKTKRMELFSEGDIDILVSTTVIEVGIDVPNATIMMILNPERFGLAQLHQLRGRVGRSEHKGFCLLIPGKDISSDAQERLEFFAKENDGFKLSEYDLQNRGPGNFFSAQQTGFADFRLASIFDMEKLEIAQQIARDLIKENPGITKDPQVRQHMPKEITTHQE